MPRLLSGRWTAGPRTAAQHTFMTPRIMSAQMLAYLRYDMPAARQKGPDAGALMAAADLLRSGC